MQGQECRLFTGLCLCSDIWSNCISAIMTTRIDFYTNLDTSRMVSNQVIELVFSHDIRSLTWDLLQYQSGLHNLARPIQLIRKRKSVVVSLFICCSRFGSPTCSNLFQLRPLTFLRFDIDPPCIHLPYHYLGVTQSDRPWCIIKYF